MPDLTALFGVDPTGPTGGGELPGGTGEVEIIRAQILWPTGVAPATWTCELPGATLDAQPDVLDPHLPKFIFGGDDNGSFTFNGLYVTNVQWSQHTKGEATVSVSGTDARGFWGRRPPYGPRRYNITYGGERQVERVGTPGNNLPSNPRYPIAFFRRTEQIIHEILDWLGVPKEVREFTGGAGFLNLRQPPGGSGAQGFGGSGTTIADDTPEFIVREGESAVAALQKIENMYGMRFSVSLDTKKVGFIETWDRPDQLTVIKTTIDGLPTLGANRPVVRVLADAQERDDVPDIVVCHGKQTINSDLLPLEPVIEDPDRKGRYIPLNRVSTMQALGINMSASTLNWITDGEPVMRFAEHCTAMANPWNMVPPRVRSYAMQALRYWRVALPMEGELEDPPGTPQGQRQGDVVDEDHPDQGTVQRRVSPLWRYRRVVQAAEAPILSDAGGRVVSHPADSGTDAQPWRVFPLLPGRPTLSAAPKSGDTGGATGSDLVWVPPEVWGADVVLHRESTQSSGHQSPDWVDLNLIAFPGTSTPLPDRAKPLGIQARLVDPKQGIIDTGEPIFGHNGILGRTREQLAEAPLAGGGPSPSPTAMRPRSALVAALDGNEIEGRSAKPEDLWAKEARSRGAQASPWATPYLWLEAAFLVNPHNDWRDWTIGYSEPPPSADGWPDARSARDGGLVQNAFTPGRLGAIPTRSSTTVTQYPPVVQTIKMPSLRLVCTSGRANAESTSAGARNFFTRNGGWRSANDGGTVEYRDIALKVPSAPGTIASSRPGEYEPVSLGHLTQVRDAMIFAVSAVAARVAAYRGTGRSAESLQADVMGWHRRFAPGVPEFALAPVEAINCEITSTPGSASASMRMSANSRSFRPYLGSDSQRDGIMSTAHQAAGASAGLTLGAGGSDDDLVTGGGGGGGGGAGIAPTASYPKEGVGGHPKALIDRRDPLTRAVTGGSIAAGQDDSWWVDPVTGEILTRREEPFLYLPVGRDWRDSILELVVGKDGREYYAPLDGLTAQFGRGARERYHPDVGESAGTRHLARQDFPILPGPYYGVERKTNADIPIILPLHFFKKQTAPGHDPGEGGVIMTRDALPIEDAAVNRDSIDEMLLTPMERDVPGISGNTHPEVSGPGWCALLALMQEYLTLDASSNALYRSANPPTGEFGDVLDEPTVREYLILEPPSILTTTGLGNYCNLVPMAGQSSLPRLDLNPYSHQTGLAMLAEWTQRLAREGLAMGAMRVNIQRNRQLLSHVTSVIRHLICCMVDHAGEFSSAIHVDMANCLFDLSARMPEICEAECEGADFSPSGGGT